MHQWGKISLLTTTLAFSVGMLPSALAQPSLPDTEEAGTPPSLPGPEAEPVEEPEIEEAPSQGEDLSVEERIGDLEDKVLSMEERTRQARELKIESTPITFKGYVDTGFFVPLGNGGVGWVQDFGNAAVPGYTGRYGWVFLGDILSTAVNTRGEAADMGDAAGAADRFDSIDSKGAASFLVNEVNFGMNVGLSDRAMLRTSVNFVPRSGKDFAFGDFIDVDLAEIEYEIGAERKISFFAGKMLPVFGIEYKERKSDQRFGITPSLVGRYTNGSQLGIKTRAKILDDWLIVAAALTNGTHVVEPFHFKSEIDTNVGKTVSGRVAVNVPMGRLIESRGGDKLEIGISGSWGPQDVALSNNEAMWFLGADLTYKSVNYAFKAQWLRGFSRGLAIDEVWGLNLRGSGYAEFDWMIIPEFGVMVRGGLRDALVDLGTERAYLTKSWRATVGARMVLGPNVLVKAEYLHNGEFGEVEEFANDIVTSSLVLHY